MMTWCRCRRGCQRFWTATGRRTLSCAMCRPLTSSRCGVMRCLILDSGTVASRSPAPCRDRRYNSVASAAALLLSVSPLDSHRVHHARNLGAHVKSRPR